MKRWSKSEKILLVLTLVFLVLLGIKSRFFDGYLPQDDQETKVMELALEKVSVNRFSSYKVVKIRELKPEYFDDLDLDYGYIVVIRKYFLGIIPYGEMRILE